MNKPTDFKSILTGAYSVTTCTGYTMCTHSGIRYKQLNQDYMLASSFPISAKEKLWLFGVFDGHGKAGEIASKTAAESLTSFFRDESERLIRETVQPMNDKEWYNYMSKTMEAAFLNAHEKIIGSYSKMSTYEDYNGTFWTKIPGLENQTEWSSAKRSDLNDFGTTAVVTLVRLISGRPTQMVVANSGDSLAYLMSGKGKSLILTTNVHACKNQEEVKRVSSTMTLEGIYFGVKPQLSPNYHFYGLAMTRALGHKFLSTYGVIPDPSTYSYPLEKSDQYLILSSDGVSDVITEDELNTLLCDLIAKGYPLADATQLIIKNCLERWLIKFPNSKIPAEIMDNTSIIIVELNKLS